MKVKATQPMTKLIKERFPTFGVRLVKFTPDEYKTFVDYDVFRNEKDYNPRTGKLQAIRIDYPADCYAMPRYVTTKDLIRVFMASDRTLSGFISSLENEIAI